MLNNYIIQSKDDILIKKSSSGGMFAQLAKYVLSQNGVVFGCAMNRVEDGFDVKHIYIEDEKDLYMLQGSKYVQSNLGNTIKQAKEFLDNGKLVLFSGTPCQIVGLKAYLKQDYENLLTVDLSCTGTPSLEIFNDFIKTLECKYKQKIVNFEFRNKQKMGWSCGNALLTFENGKEKVIYNNETAYLNLFINKKIQKKSCQLCQYNGLNRVSDITLADAWGVDRQYSKLLNTKFKKWNGISLILINSNKGNLYFKNIKENLIFENINIKTIQRFNGPLNQSYNNLDLSYLEEYKKNGYIGIKKIFQKRIGWKLNYYKIKNNSPKFIKNIIKLFINKQQKVDCLLMTWYGQPNYGSLLTAYSLQKTINNLGYSTKLIHYMDNSISDVQFIKRYLPLTKYCLNYKDFEKLNKISDIFIVGSDSLLNYPINTINTFTQSLLNFSNNEKKRLMISGSIGEWDGRTKDEEEHNYIKYLLNRFDYISTREEHGKEVFENVFDCKADWINDPVFYLEKQDFIYLTKDIKENYSNKIMQYILYPTENTQQIIDYYKNKLNKDIIKFEGNDNVKKLITNKNKSVEYWLYAILNSDLIITDSFHCVVFSLIFNKKFVCIKNTHATVRFTSLFKRLGINIPLIETVDELPNYNFSYDKNTVNKNLNDIRNFAIDKIYEQLLKPKNNHIENKNMEEYNKEFIKQNTPWYKKNKLFYFGIIVPFVIPVKRNIQYKKRNNQ